MQKRTKKKKEIELKYELKRMLLEFLIEIEKENWFGKEGELINRFVFTKLIQNIGCCKELYSSSQISIESRVKQITNGKNAVCKDLIIWRQENQNFWSKRNIPLCIMEWKHRNRKPSAYDINWLIKYTKLNKECFGIALNVENEEVYNIKATLIEKGKIKEENFI